MNFLELYKEYAEELTDAPANYHEYIGITVAGIMLGNSCYLPYGDTRIYPNIWLILLGDSSFSRKTTSINIGKKLLNEVCPERIYPNEFSQEKIQSLLETKPAGCFFFSEFLSLMGLLSRDYMTGTKGFLADMFDSPFSYRRETGKNTIKIENPSISIISATTQSWFTTKMSESDVMGGFIPRFLMVMPSKKTKSISLPPESDYQKKRILINKLSELQSVEGLFFIKPDARLYFDEWYGKLSTWPGNGRVQPFVHRMQIYTLKFAMIISVVEHLSLKVGEESMAKAVSMMLRLCKDLTQVEEEDLVFGKVQVNMKKVIDYLRKHNESSKSDLLRNIRLTSKEFTEAITTLVESERVKEKMVRTSTKPLQLFSLVEHDSSKS